MPSPTLLRGFLFLCGTLPVFAQQSARPAPYIPVVPKPASFTAGPGKIVVNASNRVVCSSPALKRLAELHTDDIRRVHSVKLAEPTVSTTPSPGDIFIRGASDLKGEAYRISAKGSNIVIEAGSYDGLAFAIMTNLQLLSKAGEALSIPQLLISDQPSREYRALQSGIKVNGQQGKGNYYGIPLLKKHIELCRFYKVRYFQIQTSEAQWMFATLKSSNSISQDKLEELNLYSKSQWDELIKFAQERGVHLVPHNESTPEFGGMKEALAKFGNTGNDWIKEIYADEKVTLADGRDGVVTEGQHGVSGDDPDYAKAIEIFTRRSYKQFAAGFQNHKLPTYHMGPVQGEGGTSPAEMAKILGYLRAEDPDVKLLFWGGPNPNDPIIQEHKKDIIVDLYSSAQLHAPIQEYLDAGLNVINASWRPTYILPDLASSLRDIYDNTNLFRMGSDGVFEPIIWTMAKETPQVVGALMSEWDFATPTQGQFEAVIPRLPVWVERIWNHQPYKNYKPTDYDLEHPRFMAVAKVADRFLAEEAPPSVPQYMSATKDVYTDHVRLTWLESTNFPGSYDIYRSTDSNSANAKLLKNTSELVFRDDDVKPGTTYHYWVKAVNQYGASAFSNPAQGSVGNTVALPIAYEAFDYPIGQTIHGKNGGKGMSKGPWNYGEAVGPYTIVKGLTYSTLATSGGALSIHPNKEGHGPEYQVTRPIDGKIDVEGTTLWYSFLFQVQEGGAGDGFFTLNERFGGYRGFTNDHGTAIFGLRMGGKISRNFIMDYADGKALPTPVYFMVFRADFTSGLDRGYYWINPGATEPDIDKAMMKLSGMVSVGRDDFNGFLMVPQGHGSPQFVIDELRVGPDYASVAPGIAKPTNQGKR
jgi:hypothetical protein